MAALEKHYSVAEVSALWNLSEDTIRRIFRDRSGVLKIGVTGLRRRKREYVVLRIPETILQQVHAELRG